MEWILAGSGLITIVTIACSCLFIAVILGAIGFFLYRLFKGMSGNSGLVKTGVAGPAVILEVQDTGMSMNNSMQARLTLQVTPQSRAKYSVGRQVYVRYDLYGDKKQVAMDRAA